MKLRHLLFTLLLPFFGLSQTVVDIVVGSENHNTLETAIVEAGLVGALSGDGPFTVFAPTDDAFNALPEGALDGLLADPSGALTQVLLYHTATGKALSTDLSDGISITTINGASITVTVNSDGVFINNARVSMADIDATNGVVHVLDAVLLPPAPENVVDVIVNSPLHNTLETAVVAADLAGTLSGDGPFTVFAPTDDAFDALPVGALDGLLADPTGALTDVLLGHVEGAETSSEDIFDELQLQSLNRKGLDFTVTEGGDIFVNGSQIIVTDITTPNGIVHVIDAVILPNFSVMDIIEDSDDHNTLEAAIDAAGLTTTLHSGDIEVTVFAPTDAAFDALPEGTVETLLEDPSGQLTDILLYHVSGGATLADDLSDGLLVDMVTGKQATVSIAGGKVMIEDAEIVITDLQTDNGVVHVIDAVLTPTTTIVDIVNNSPNHTILSQLLTISGLEFILNANGAVTLFAPDDTAIAALGQANIDALLANPQLLETVLVYHLLQSGAVLSTDITDGLVAETALGLDVLLNLLDGDVIVNQNSLVNATDLQAENGVVHSVSGVLLPGTTAGVISNSQGFETLTSALEASQLLAAFNDIDTRTTLFAPTNAAFEALPEGVLDELLADPTGDLATILATHATEGRAFAASLSDAQVITTLSGEKVTVSITDGNVFINNAQVIQADIFTGNGLIHVIDAVIQETSNTVVDIIVNSSDHNTLEAAVIAADLAGTLSGEGPFTIFAPTDAAFAGLPEGVLQSLLDDPSGELTEVLTYHVVGDLVPSSALSDGDTAPTLQGESVTVTINDDGIFINDAKVSTADIPADNGIVHVIDGVLLPEGFVNTEELPTDAVSITPTLTSDFISVSFDKDVIDNAAVYIFDNTGRLVMTELNIRNGERTDISKLVTGTYFITLTNGKKATTKKITKI